MPVAPLSSRFRAPDGLPFGFRAAAESPPPLPLPLDGVKVSAGFPSPAADYEDKRLDINDYLVRNPVSTFFFPVQGDSMEGAEIFEGDVLVVDKGSPQNSEKIVR